LRHLLRRGSRRCGKHAVERNSGTPFQRYAKSSVALSELGRVEYGSFLFAGETARYYHLPFGVT
jgi:hypothetical protein